MSSKRWEDVKSFFVMRGFDRGWVKDWKEMSEAKLDADRAWQPVTGTKDTNLPPIGGTHAVPLESANNTEGLTK